MRVLFCGSLYLIGFVFNYLLYSLFCASSKIWFFKVKKIPKKPAIINRATLAWPLTWVCKVHVLLKSLKKWEKFYEANRIKNTLIFLDFKGPSLEV